MWAGCGAGCGFAAHRFGNSKHCNRGPKPLQHQAWPIGVDQQANREQRGPGQIGAVQDEGIGRIDIGQIGIGADDAGGADKTYCRVDIERLCHMCPVSKKNGIRTLIEYRDCMTTVGRKLLVLDLDETLIFATPDPLVRPADFRLFDYHIYKRPFLEPFIDVVAQHFALAVWSSASDDYVELVVENIWPRHIPLEFVWGRSRATMRRVITDEFFAGDASDHLNYRKPLLKVKDWAGPWARS